MDNFIYFYQYLPYYFNPTALSLGWLRINWYSVMYLVGFLVVYLLLKYRIKRQENIPKNLDINAILDLLFYSFVGLIVGARLGYVLFYNFSYYLANPLAIISPYNLATHEFVGIYGLSYHGGLVGVILAGWIYAKNNNIRFIELSNFFVPAIPAGYFFGRIGNFLNGELYGRITKNFFGMYFPDDYLGCLRYPTQLFEAFFEGIVLFIFLWALRNNPKFKDKLLGIYICGYAICRIILEFFREPDEQIGYILNFLTLGQILSFFMLIFGIFLIIAGNKRKKMLE